MADQVILMREGRIEQDAAPDVLYASPATSFAARFIGTPPMNVLTLAPGPEGAVIDGAVTDGAVTDGAAGEAAHGSLPAGVICRADPAGVELGIRPEHIRLSPAHPGAGGDPGAAAGIETAAAATIETCEYFGSDTILGCLVGRQALAVRAPGKHAYEPGTRVHLAWRRTAQHFFDAATGRCRDDVA